YVMEFAPGETIESLLWNRSGRADLLLACELAGKILAQMHILRTEKISPLPVEPLARDLAAAPWHLSSREQTILQLALETFARAELRIGEIYYDYKPANLLFDNNELFLVDPPDTLRQGAHLRDFVAFQSSMRRHYGGSACDDRSIGGVRAFARAWPPLSTATSRMSAPRILSPGCLHLSYGSSNCTERRC